MNKLVEPLNGSRKKLSMLSKPLEQITADLERSRVWLAQVRTQLERSPQKTTHPLPKSDSNKHYLSVCAIIKNEAPYLIEWIEFHKIVGIEKFYLYNNDSTDRTVELLQPYVRSGEVVLEYFPASSGKVKNAYNHCLNHYGAESEWIAFIDLDEFLVPTQAEHLKPILDDYLDYPGLLVNWCCFGSSGHHAKPKGLTIENFTRRANSSFKKSNVYKSIVRPKFIEKCLTSHRFSYHPSLYPITENKKRCDLQKSHKTLTVSWKKLKINHYIIRSREEFAAKALRGDVVRRRQPRYTWEFFEEHDRNEVEDLTIQRFLPKLKQNLQSEHS